MSVSYTHLDVYKRQGVQYDPRQQHIFWEWTDSQDVMGPLDDLEFEFGEVAHDESESG